MRSFDNVISILTGPVTEGTSHRRYPVWEPGITVEEQTARLAGLITAPGRPPVNTESPRPHEPSLNVSTATTFINKQIKRDGGSGGFYLRVVAAATLRASLSGTFLQTLPDLVTPLKGHSLSPRSCPATWSVPSERFRY